MLACLQKDPKKRPQNAGELFRMAHNCHACDGWSPEMAESWWRVHLPEFTGPLTVTLQNDHTTGVVTA